MKKEKKKELDVNSMGCCVPLTGMAEAVIRAQEGGEGRAKENC
jgi:TusA-related sulfurtransferase